MTPPVLALALPRSAERVGREDESDEAKLRHLHSNGGTATGGGTHSGVGGIAAWAAAPRAAALRGRRKAQGSRVLFLCAHSRGPAEDAVAPRLVVVLPARGAL